jgi:hypothetical protein
MKSVQLAASILIMLSSVSAGAESWLRPDTQEPKCLGNTEQNLAACLKTCDKEPAAAASLCRRQCLDDQEAIKKKCDKTLRWGVPGA